MNIESDLDVGVFPNPSPGKFNLDFYGAYVGKINTAIFDVTEEKYWNRNFPNRILF